MDIQKLIQKPQAEETILIATETLRLASLSILSGVSAEKLGTLLLKRNELHSSLATFSIPAGGFQRNLLSLLSNPLQLEEGDSLILRIAPPVLGDEDWVGVSGFAYPAGAGAELPGDLTGQLTAIEQAIDEVRTEVNAIPNDFDGRLTAIQNAIAGLPSGFASNFAAVLQAIANLPAGFNAKLTEIQNAVTGLPTGFNAKLTAIETAIANLETSLLAGLNSPKTGLERQLAQMGKLELSRSESLPGLWQVSATEILALWNTSNNLAGTGTLDLGPFTLKNRMILAVVCGNPNASPELRRLRFIEQGTNAVLLDLRLNQVIPFEALGPIFRTINTAAHAGKTVRLRLEDNDPSNWMGVSSLFEIS